TGRTLCAVVDAANTRLYELSADGAGEVASIEWPVPRRHAAGGWSQLKLQHDRVEQIAHHHREAADLIARLIADSDAAARVVGGRDGSIGELLAFLPAGAQARVRRVPDVTEQRAEAAILESCARALVETERERAAERVRAVEDAVGAGARGCFGAEAVIDAA